MTIQMLATPLYAVPEVRTDIGVMQVLGFTDDGNAYCVQLGQLHGARPTRPGVWDQERHGRLSFYATIVDAHNGKGRASERMERRSHALEAEAHALISGGVR